MLIRSSVGSTEKCEKFAPRLPLRPRDVNRVERRARGALRLRLLRLRGIDRGAVGVDVESRAVGADFGAEGVGGVVAELIRRCAGEVRDDLALVLRDVVLDDGGAGAA